MFFIERKIARCLINIQNGIVHIVVCVETDLDQFIKILKHMCSSSVGIVLL